MDERKIAQTSDKFEKAVVAIIKETGVKPGPSAPSKISRVVFESLYEIGLILDRLSSDFGDSLL